MLKWRGPLLLVLLSILAVAIHVAAYEPLGVHDEMTHFDTVLKAPRPIQHGELVSQEAMEVAACRGFDGTIKGWAGLPPCVDGAIYDPADFQFEGENTASGYTPLYYTVTRIIATPMTWFGISMFDASRLAGAVWLAAGVLLTYALGRRLGIGRGWLTGSLAVAIYIPIVLYQAATIIPDAAALLVGSGMIWATLAAERSPRTRWWLPVLAAFLVVALKQVNLLVIGLVCVYAIIRIVQKRVKRPGAFAAAMGGSVVAAGFLIVAWTVFVKINTLTTNTPMDNVYKSDGLPLIEVVNKLGFYLFPYYFLGAHGPDNTVGLIVQIIATGAWTLAMIGVVVFGFWSLAGRIDTGRLRHSRQWALALALVLTGIFGAPAMTVFGYVTAGAYFSVPQRYAISILSGVILIGTWGMQQGWRLLRTRESGPTADSDLPNRRVGSPTA